MKRVWLEREGSGKGLVPKQADFYRLGPRDNGLVKSGSGRYEIHRR
jgi:hypothetical protein